MNIHKAIKIVSDKFEYKSDKKGFFDKWYVMKENAEGKMRGDCEDFSLTVFWNLSDKKLGKFLWNLLITHKYELHQVRTKSGGNHAIGCYEGVWFDNWTKEGLSKKEFFRRTSHKYVKRRWSISFYQFLIAGLFVNKD